MVLIHKCIYSSRSQSASTVSDDGSLLHIISGYNDFSEDGLGLTTMQSVGLQGTRKEKRLGVALKPYSSSLTSAVSLSSGDVILTGGQGQGSSAFLLGGPDMDTWTRLKSMLSSRYGHASSRIGSAQEEFVIVAGGWDSRGAAQSKVELYSVKQDAWNKLQDMPSPRVLFTLQVFVLLML